MSREKAPKEKEVIERAALLVAQESFLNWRNLDDEFAGRKADLKTYRAAFNALAAAVKSLQKALPPFGVPGSLNRETLLQFLQNGQQLRPKSHYEKYLDWLTEFLCYVGPAAQCGGGRGVTAEAKATAWVLIAADQWQKTVGSSPSAAQRGRFLLALEALEDDSEAKSIYLPKVSREVVRDVLAKRKEFHWGA